ncbi:MAG: glycosyltransferase family 4 protein [Bacilli bacterium]|jgi:glycosyltransferase involved in cell wall biosynthesis|nr:glycosyltransferase family 4 protein [Bacilli bacterium]MDD3389012.1 glycosyltransferase family 4 protein [Bacilli bacterium]MDD4344451.1 glycosyltransferase family 4 protein [Bacilli bacterium]MDD4520645.1 glycosyltransferase family 4 protein [Bacilli bacterium]MDY0399380.1 glycosyltransferase family 4 protein [Bacilli bacterium]
MKVFITFNHPAPYKVALFNGLASFFDLHVIFERTKARNRNKIFYQDQQYKFNFHTIRGWCLGDENFLSWGIKKHLKQNSYDLIVMNGYSTIAEMIALRYLKKHHIPYIFAINGGVVRTKENRFKRGIKHYFIDGATFYLSPSEEADRYLLHYGVERKRILHYPYSTIYEHEIATKKITSLEKRFLRKQLGIDGEQVFISVGQFIERKNNMRLLKIWKLMPKSRTLVLIGDGPDRVKYENFIKDNKIENVCLLNFKARKDVLNLLRISDYAIFLSKEDIYGHVVNEALSQGLGVIASNKMVAARTLVQDGSNGFLVDPENEAQVLFSINTIVTKDFYHKAIEVAKQNTIEAMVARHVEIFSGADK